MSLNNLTKSLEAILKQYGKSFSEKAFGNGPSEVDDLMLVFGLSQDIKAQNKQYWGRELGMCWQLLLTELFKQTCDDFRDPIKEGSDELCDFVVGNDAVDTKYRIGSGDSGTLKKFKQYAAKLKDLGYRPVLLILRDDNLPAAITACKTGGWSIYINVDAYKYINGITGFNLLSWLKSKRNRYSF